MKIKLLFVSLLFLTISTLHATTLPSFRPELHPQLFELNGGGLIKQRHSFAPIIQQSTSKHEVAHAVKRELAELFQTGHYDRSVYLWETGVNPFSPTADKVSAYKSLAFNSLSVFEKCGTSNCVGFALYLQKKIFAQTGVRFQVIPSTAPKRYQQPGVPVLGHVALLGWFADGFMLVDPVVAN